MSSLRIVQFSDTHIFADANAELLGVNTQMSFKEVVNLLPNENMDCIILSGDLSQDGDVNSYRFIAHQLNQFDVPVYYLPGNHDNPLNMEKVFPIKNIFNKRHILIKNHHLIFLNSQKKGSVEGYLDQAEILFLKKCLDDYPNVPAIIMLHHQPFDVNVTWLDPLGLQNKATFWEALLPYQNVCAVLFGHVHQAIEKVYQNIPCYSAPATCFQFLGNQVDFYLENIPPGYRWIEFTENGSINTKIVRTPHYVGRFDPDSKGYK